MSKDIKELSFKAYIKKDLEEWEIFLCRIKRFLTIGIEKTWKIKRFGHKFQNTWNQKIFLTTGIEKTWKIWTWFEIRKNPFFNCILVNNIQKTKKLEQKMISEMYIWKKGQKKLGLPGFEPGSAGREASVLPLDHGGIAGGAKKQQDLKIWRTFGTNGEEKKTQKKKWFLKTRFAS